MLVGQERLKRFVSSWDVPPRLTILSGDLGSGRNTAIGHICGKFGYDVIEAPVRAEDMRELIATSYTLPGPTFLVARDGADMSPACVASLLKATEEPPRNAYFIIRTSGAVIETLRSRAFLYEMSPYTDDEIRRYCSDNGNAAIYDRYGKVIRSIGQARKFLSSPVDDISEYCILIADHIGDTCIGNVLKITSRLNMTDSVSDKWDITVFLAILERQFLERLKAVRKDEFFQAMFAIQRLRNDLRTNGIDRQCLFDNFLVDLSNILSI